jgi:hypothetical protein
MTIKIDTNEIKHQPNCKTSGRKIIDKLISCKTKKFVTLDRVIRQFWNLRGAF